MKYKVTMISEEKHKYMMEVIADTPEEAISFVMVKIDENGWSHYNYKLYEIIPSQM